MDMPISPWVAAAWEAFSKPDLPVIYQKTRQEFSFEVYLDRDTLWLVAHFPKGNRLAFRMTYFPEGNLEIQDKEVLDNRVIFKIKATAGDFTTTLEFPEPEQPLFHFTTVLKPKEALLLPFFPRDLVPLGKMGNTGTAEGEIHASQVGLRTGLLHASLTKPKSGSFFYLQNLTALNDYFEQTCTSAKDTVGEQFPELGFALPPSEEKKPLAAGKEWVISDVFAVLTPDIPADNFEMARQFLDLFAAVYLHLPRPETKFCDWLHIVHRTNHDLLQNKGCWTHVAGHNYLNAYMSDYKTPPEIMVQLAVLLPLKDYARWSGEKIYIEKDIEDAVHAFYDEKIGAIARWLPAAADRLQGEEEHKNPRVMDSWYLHHPLLNLWRMAKQGNKEAKKLALKSTEYAIKVARHFKYKWPIFYNIDTLEVIKAEAEPGKGGEKDVAGIYAHVMLQAWEVTGQKRFFEEAERAAKSLKEYGFDIFYQANNTAFGAKSLLILWKETGDELYLKLSYLCVAALMKNMWIWECNYGYAKNYSTFFAMFPLDTAPYIAVYEEQEVHSAFREYLEQAGNLEIAPSVRLFMAEYMRFFISRAEKYYPTLLPKEMLVEKPKTGEIDTNAWIPLEDLYEGWHKAGEVGQEVYGAGMAFGLTPPHHHLVPDENFLVFADYPMRKFTSKPGNPITFRLNGDERLQCRMRLIPIGEEPLPEFTVVRKQSREKEEIEGKITEEGHIEYALSGNDSVTISWIKSRQKGGTGKKQVDRERLKMETIE